MKIKDSDPNETRVLAELTNMELNRFNAGRIGRDQFGYEYTLAPLDPIMHEGKTYYWLTRRRQSERLTF